MRQPMKQKDLVAKLLKGATLTDLGEIWVPSHPKAIHVLKTEDSEEESSGSRQLRLLMSDKSVDRDNDTIDPRGWELDQFNKNGAILWAHNNSIPPIAESLGAEVVDDALFVDTKFPDQGISDFSDLLFNLIQANILKNTSVGFIPIEWIVNEERRGIDFIKQVLIEASIVPVGSNPNTMVDEAKAKGFNLDPLKAWASACLDGEDDVLVERELVETLYKSLSAPVVSVSGKRPISWRRAHPDGTPLAARDAEWDGSKERREAEVEDLLVMSAWVDEENTEAKSSYKLPHHRAAGDHALVWRGVTTAMGALLGARGGTDIPDEDKQGVYDHLAQHYREFDEEPPELRVYTTDELKALFPDLVKSSADESTTEANEGENSGAELRHGSNDAPEFSTLSEDRVREIVLEEIKAVFAGMESKTIESAPQLALTQEQVDAFLDELKAEVKELRSEFLTSSGRLPH